MLALELKKGEGNQLQDYIGVVGVLIIARREYFTLLTTILLFILF